MNANRSLRATLGFVAIFVLFLGANTAAGLSKDRWTDETPYGLFFNDYDPNFYTGFVPRVQEEERIKIHLARGNQLRVRMILPDETVDNFLPDQVAKHDLYKEVIDKGVITLTTNTSWEDYDKKFKEADIRAMAAKRGEVSEGAWRKLNIEAMERLNPERVYHIQKDFGKLVDQWAALLKKNPAPEDLGQRLDLINEFFPHRMFVYELSAEREAAFDELDQLAKSDDLAAFRPKAKAFFEAVTDGIYPIDDGKIDYYEYTAIYAAGTYDTTTQFKGHAIPRITTQGIWYFQPRLHGNGQLGMVDYISGAGYYGLIPMFPYEYGGGESYNSIHNTGISNWIAGHKLLPKDWRNYTKGSRNGKPYNRVALTSRGPVSHGCTRLNSGHLAELRELTPSTSDGLKGIVNYRNVSQCYDVFDRKGDGDVEIMGVQYYFAFRSTRSRVAKQIWAQNNRKDYYDWLYADEMNYGPIGDVTFDEVCEGKFEKRKAAEGKSWKNLRLYEAPYQPETLQFYKIKGVNSLSHEGMEFNRELRRVGHGYEVNRKILRLE